MKSTSTDRAPKAIGPYSQAIVAGGFVFCSGQVAFHPTSGVIENPESVEAQAHQCLANLKEVLLASGSNMRDVCKTTVFLKDLNDFATVNGVYAEHFGNHMPARSTVEVSRLPKDALVEIEAIAQVHGT